MKLSGDKKTGEFIVSDIRTGKKTRVVSLTTGQRLMGIPSEEIPIENTDTSSVTDDNDDFSDLFKLLD